MLTSSRIDEMAAKASKALEDPMGLLTRHYMVAQRSDPKHPFSISLPHVILDSGTSIGGIHTKLIAVIVTDNLVLEDTPFITIVGTGSPPRTSDDFYWCFVESRYPF